MRGEGGRQGEAKQGAAGAEGGSTSVQMCMYVRACVCVCLREKEEEQDRSLILLSRFQVRRMAWPAKVPGAAVPRGGGTR